MRILITQLARLGDIYTTYPVLFGLMRKHPEAEIHFLVRNKFSVATRGLPKNIFIHELDTKLILSPIVLDDSTIEDGIIESFGVLDQFLERLKSLNFNKIINLSFSPFSSFLTQFLTSSTTDVAGYTRHKDGYLAIPDEVSAYFYAQVGVNRFNRVHLSELFASISEVNIEPKDWCYLSPDPLSEEETINKFHLQGKGYIAIHVGASQEEKSLPPFKWQQVVQKLVRSYDGHVVLLGSPDEIVIVDRILSGVDWPRVISLVGKTSVEELFPIIKHSDLMIGCDSVPMHISNFTKTPCLNLSFACVNFWETGPLSKGSRIIYADSKDELVSDRIVAEIIAQLNDVNSNYPVILRKQDGVVSYQCMGYGFPTFAWDFIKAIYMSEQFPISSETLTISGLQRLYEISLLALEQLELINDLATRQHAVDVLSQVDQLIMSVQKFAPHTQPLISWFETERLRMGPGDLEQVLLHTKLLFKKLNTILSQYHIEQDIIARGVRNADTSLVK